MPRWISAALVSLVVLAGCSGSSHPPAAAEQTLPAPPGSVKLTSGDLGRTITLQQGQTVYVTLPPNRFKLGWQPPQVNPSSVLTVLAYRNPPKGGVTAVIKAWQVGRAQLEVSYDCNDRGNRGGACNGWGVFVEVVGGSPSGGAQVGSPATVGDVDGDGRPDSAYLVDLGPSGDVSSASVSERWRLVVRASSVGTRSVDFKAGPPSLGGVTYVRIVGSADASHSGRSDIFVNTWMGASTFQWTIFSLVGNVLRQVTVDGMPVELGVDGTVTHQAGFTCSGNHLTTIVEQLDQKNNVVDFFRKTYVWQGSQLVLSGQQSGTTTGTVDVAVSCGNLPSPR